MDSAAEETKKKGASSVVISDSGKKNIREGERREGGREREGERERGGEGEREISLGHRLKANMADNRGPGG